MCKTDDFDSMNKYNIGRYHSPFSLQFLCSMVTVYNSFSGTDKECMVEMLSTETHTRLMLARSPQSKDQTRGYVSIVSFHSTTYNVQIST